MTRERRRTLVLLTALGLGLSAWPSGDRPAAAAERARPDLALLELLAANPATAPYRYTASLKSGRVHLSGRVATKAIHDVAIQTAIASGIPVVDNLVIDTAEAARALPLQAPAQPVGVPYGSGFFYNQTYGSFVSDSGIPYLYPAPLFGRLDDPLFGLDPPAITYPPYWGPLSARRLGEAVGMTVPFADQAAVVPGASDFQAAGPSVGPSRGHVEMIIDPRGVAVLKGEVATLAEKLLIGQRAVQAPGVTAVRNDLVVRDPSAAEAAGGGTGQAPGVPNFPPPPPAPPEGPPPGPPIQPAADPVADRLNQAMARDALLQGQRVGVTVRNGVATLTGRLPGPVEAMRAYRAAEQTPGVREVVDRLEFPVPEEGKPNPLRQRGAPEDVGPYLLAQARRQVGDLAHIDRLSLDGDRVEVRGRLAREADRPRVEAILRSMPLLRGFAPDLRLEADAGP